MPAKQKALEAEKVLIFPNPVKDYLTIKFPINNNHKIDRKKLMDDFKARKFNS